MGEATVVNEVMGAPHQLCRTETGERLTMENQVVGRSAEMSVLSDGSGGCSDGFLVGADYPLCSLFLSLRGRRRPAAAPGPSSSGHRGGAVTAGPSSPG